MVASWRAMRPALIANFFRLTHFVPPIGEEATIRVPSAATSTEEPNDPLPVDAKPLPCPFTELQPSPSTMLTSASLTFVCANIVEEQQESSNEEGEEEMEEEPDDVVKSGGGQTLTGSERESECLPEGWNQNRYKLRYVHNKQLFILHGIISQGAIIFNLLPRSYHFQPAGKYKLRYVHNKQLFILHGITSQGAIIFNLLRTSDKAITIVHFQPEEMVTSLEGESIEEIVPKYRAVIDTVSNTLIAPQVSLNRQEISTQTSRTTPTIVNVEPMFESRNIILPERLLRNPERHPLRIGQDDLNPLGRTGGGMIFDPFNSRGRGGIPDPGIGIPGGLPRGSIPPGARFDPFGPPGSTPNPGRFGRGPPDADHLPPPGYDDMFM
uniref:PI31 proteasome regulator C-terminal domain-containing protein n=1 Tax=Timema cristinae TaxID=61476 RepID=A0A7R9GX54_TIMCR|nr:unnamed protein product [Timema cristinae]